MKFALTYDIILLTIVLSLSTLVVCYGVRNGLYNTYAFITKQKVDQLKKHFTLENIRKKSVQYKWQLLVIDPLFSWLAVGIVTFGFVTVLVIRYSPMLHAIVTFLFIVWGCIFPFRLAVRLYQWSKIYVGVYPIIWVLCLVACWITGLVLSYIVFFVSIRLAFPIIDWLFMVSPDFIWGLFQQIYYQHINGYALMTGLTVVYLLYDAIRFDRKKYADSIEEESDGKEHK